MLRRCSSCLLVTTNTALQARVEELALACNIALRVEETWKQILRVQQDVVICDSNKLESINEAFHSITVVALGEGENFVPFKNEFDRFIFNVSDDREILYAFLKPEATKLFTNSKTMSDILTYAPATSFEKGDYVFKFDKDIYSYKGKGIFLTEGEKSYLALWLLKGYKDNSKRQYLFKMRQRLGKAFLKDVDRLGRIVGENE